MQRRLLVEFSCEFPHHTSFEVYSLVRSFVLCDKWLPQQHSIQLKIVTSIYVYLIKSHYNLNLSGCIFSKAEFTSTIKKYSSLFTPESNPISWSYLKYHKMNYSLICDI